MSPRNRPLPHRAIRVFVLNDHPLFVEVLARYLRGVPGLQLAGAGGRGPGTYTQLARGQPDVVVVDPGKLLTEVEPMIKHLRQLVPNAAIIVLTTNYHDAYPDVAHLVGADGFIDNQASVDDLADAIYKVGV